MWKKLRPFAVIALWGTALPMLAATDESEIWSGFGEMELRKDYSGRLVRGTVRISPRAQETQASDVLKIAREPAQGWTGNAPQWDSTQVPDGWHDATLTENSVDVTEALAVLNRGDVVVHSGLMKANETWKAGKVHVVKHWVRIPPGMTLTIEANSIVKFCHDTGLQVDGTLIARSVTFTTVDDDTVGGDTDVDGDKADSVGYDIVVNGKADLTGSAWRLGADETWIAGSVHVIHGTLKVLSGRRLTIEPGAVVKFATGARLEAQKDATVICDGSIFTHLPDDTIGGDTEQNGGATKPEHDQYALAGFTPPESCDLRYLSLVYRGWNLLAPGADLTHTENNRRLLEALNVFRLEQDAFVRLELPIPTGEVIWVHSGEVQCIPFDYGEARQRDVVIQDGWTLVGVPESGRTLAAGTYDCVWTWSQNHFELKQAESDGSVRLLSGRGYFVYRSVRP